MPMKGKPLLLAVVTFAIVLIGGAAMAGVGTYWSGGDASMVAYPSGGESATKTTEAAEEIKTTTTSEPEKETTPTLVPDTEKDEAVPADAPKEEASEESAKGEAAEKESEVSEPLFTLSHPLDDARFETSVVTFGGTALEGISIHRGKFVAESIDGEWSMKLVLSPGKNRVVFETVGQDGEISHASVTVYYDAPKDDSKEEPKDETVAFVAYQTYGTCSLEVPYDVFYGKAKPGTKITASSAYGSGSTTANENGKWELKVFFADAPANKTFSVKLKASTGQSQSFSFTATPEG